MIQQENSICLILCFLEKKLPSYFNFFLKTASWNSTVNFIIFSESNEDLHVPENVKFIPFNFNDFNSLSSKKLGVEVNVGSQLKLNDFRPAYGNIFEDYLEEYNFWGYLDSNVLLGNIRECINNDTLGSFDYFSSVKKAHLSLYRNNTDSRNLYKHSGDWKIIFSSRDYLSFDIQNLNYLNFLKDNLESEGIPTEKDTICDNIENKNIRLNTNLQINDLESSHLFEVTKNKIFNLTTNEQSVLLFLGNVDRNPSYQFSKFDISDNKFYVDFAGLISCTEQSTKTTIERHTEILNFPISINYQNVTISKNQVIINFNDEKIELSKTNLLHTQILLFIHEYKTTTGLNLVDFFYDSNVFSIQKNGITSKESISVIILNAIQILLRRESLL